MHKSICIKTNNKDLISFLYDNIQNSNISNTYITISNFKHYINLILHYKGKHIDDFIAYFAEIISTAYIFFYENLIITSILKTNYFYFSMAEQNLIFKTISQTLNSSDSNDAVIRKDILTLNIFNYLQNNTILNIDGFISFRAKEYILCLDNIIDFSVNKFVIDKEYSEFIDLLKLYISSKAPIHKTVHLVYNNNSLILDENKNIIDTPENYFNLKYLSDITFSANDFALSTLLSLLPEKIIVHLINPEDEFINTLKLIFNNKLILCADCDLCNLYRSEKLNLNN